MDWYKKYITSGDSGELVNAIEDATKSYSPLSPHEIANGHCLEWALKVKEENNDVIVKDVDLWKYRGNENLPYHVWIEYNGKAFDAETLNGVNSFKELPYFKNHSNQVVVNKLKSRVFPKSENLK